MAGRLEDEEYWHASEAKAFNFEDDEFGSQLCGVSKSGTARLSQRVREGMGDYSTCFSTDSLSGSLSRATISGSSRTTTRPLHTLISEKSLLCILNAGNFQEKEPKGKLSPEEEVRILRRQVENRWVPPPAKETVTKILLGHPYSLELYRSLLTQFPSVTGPLDTVGECWCMLSSGTSTRLRIAVHSMLPVSPFRALGVWCLLVVVLPSHGDILSGVQLVTELSNSLVPKLFQALAPGRENLVFSPFGLATNVAMLLEAANGNTAKEILRALNISADSLPDLRTGFKVYCDTFEAAAENPEAAGSFNTALMVSSQPLLPSYKAVLSKFYRANITDISRFDNFTGVRPASVSLELRSDSGVMSHWKDYDQLAAFSFLSHQTAAPFHRTLTDTIAVPMVPQAGLFRAGRVHQLNAHAVELPLQVGSVNLLLLVPDSADNLDELLVKLPAVSLQQLVQEWLPFSDVSVSLPQLTIISSAVNVTPFLRQLGIRSAFNTTSADLSAAVVAPAIHIKSVTQDAFFSVSFTSVNGVGAVSANLVPKRLKRAATNLVVDRPFLFFLLHRDTQLVLLAGKVQNPTQVP